VLEGLQEKLFDLQALYSKDLPDAELTNRSDDSEEDDPSSIPDLEASSSVTHRDEEERHTRGELLAGGTIIFIRHDRSSLEDCSLRSTAICSRVSISTSEAIGRPKRQPVQSLHPRDCAQLTVKIATPRPQQQVAICPKCYIAMWKHELSEPQPFKSPPCLSHVAHV